MNQICSDCNSSLTPSAVGMLCAGCGKLHKFEKASATAAVKVHTLAEDKPPAEPEKLLPEDTAVQDLPADVDYTQKPVTETVKPIHKTASESKPAHTKKTRTSKPAKKYSLKHHMKRLMVPELPAAHSNLSSYSNDPATIAQAEMTPQPKPMTDISSKYNAQFETDAAAPVQPKPVVISSLPDMPDENDVKPKKNTNWPIIVAVVLLFLFAIVVFWPR